MSTNALIAVIRESDVIESVYHHWDGYPEWLGVQLPERYSDIEKLIHLMEGGDISSIGSNQDWDRNELEEPTVLYYNDRGEKTRSHVCANKSQLFRRGENMGCDYIYLFDGVVWWCYQRDYDSGGWLQLAGA